MVRFIECTCESNYTCGYCLRNAKPWHFTPTPLTQEFSTSHQKWVEAQKRDKELEEN